MAIEPDPRRRDLVTFALALGAVAAGAHHARNDEPSDAELRAFTAVNGLSHRPFVPVWVVMQLGNLAGSLATGAVVAATGRPALGRRLAVVGALTWVGSKVVKPVVQRGRPTTVMPAARVLGREQSGLGYPSGHAGVAVAMAAAAAPHLPRRWRPPLWATAAGVGASRLYVGAHLPLDVAGGMALGLATERAVRLVTGRA